MLNNEISLQIEPGKRTRGTVRKQLVGPDGQQTGRYDDNPYLNSIVYEVEFDDGGVKEYAANIIAENMLMGVDDDGYSTTMIEAIVDFQKDGSWSQGRDEGDVGCLFLYGWTRLLLSEPPKRPLYLRSTRESATCWTISI